MAFKDHFSGHAAEYAKFRPDYPAHLFDHLASMSPRHHLAWDCGTGNGQAAVGLADRFDRVIATDASAEQIENAQLNERVEYRVAAAEASGLPSGSCDVITVAQALHWFRLDDFYPEAKRVLKPRGLLAVWTYNQLRVSPEVDAIVRHYHDAVVGPHWPPERKLVGRAYLDLPFPFEEIATPKFQIEVHWTLEHLLGYLRSWSATHRFMAARGSDPVALIADGLARAWGNPNEPRLASWRLTTRIGRA